MKTAIEILVKYCGIDINRLDSRNRIVMAMEEYAEQFKPKWLSVETPPEKYKKILCRDKYKNVAVVIYKSDGFWQQNLNTVNLFNAVEWAEIPL